MYFQVSLFRVWISTSLKQQLHYTFVTISCGQMQGSARSSECCKVPRSGLHSPAVCSMWTSAPFCSRWLASLYALASELRVLRRQEAMPDVSVLQSGGAGVMSIFNSRALGTLLFVAPCCCLSVRTSFRLSGPNPILAARLTAAPIVVIRYHTYPPSSSCCRCLISSPHSPHTTGHQSLLFSATSPFSPLITIFLPPSSSHTSCCCCRLSVAHCGYPTIFPALHLHGTLPSQLLLPRGPGRRIIVISKLYDD